MAKTLEIPDGKRAQLWLKIIGTLRADPTLKRVFGERWHVMDGDTDDQTGMPELEAPAIRLMPRLGPMQRYSRTEFIGPLMILFEVLVDGLDALDVLNLQDAIETALYPDDNAAQLALHNAFEALGAETGEADFSNPLTDTGNAWQSDQQHLRGVIAYNVRRSLNR